MAATRLESSRKLYIQANSNSSGNTSPGVAFRGIERRRASGIKTTVLIASIGPSHPQVKRQIVAQVPFHLNTVP